MSGCNKLPSAACTGSLQVISWPKSLLIVVVVVMSGSFYECRRRSTRFQDFASPLPHSPNANLESNLNQAFYSIMNLHCIAGQVCKFKFLFACQHQDGAKSNKPPRCLPLRGLSSLSLSLPPLLLRRLHSAINLLQMWYSYCSSESKSSGCLESVLPNERGKWNRLWSDKPPLNWREFLDFDIKVSE